MSLNWRMNKETMVYPHNEIPLSDKKGMNSQYVQQCGWILKVPDPKGNTLLMYYSICMTFRKRQNYRDADHVSGRQELGWWGGI